MLLKDKVKQYRTNNKLTQKEFANKLGISRGYLGDIESGKVKGNIKILKALSNATGTDINYWVNENEDITLNNYEVLNSIIDNYIEIGLIKKDGTFSDEIGKTLLEVLKKEIELKLERKKETI